MSMEAWMFGHLSLMIGIPRIFQFGSLLENLNIDLIK